jgi:hypothetical protein
VLCHTYQGRNGLCGKEQYRLSIEDPKTQTSKKAKSESCDGQNTTGGCKKQVAVDQLAEGAGGILQDG